MRFDDSLRTVLNSDVSTGFGAQSAWRQLVDLAGRGRAPTDEPIIARLRMLRDAVPAEVRAASARALAYARPDARLVALFAEDTLAIAAPVLRTAELPGEDWTALLPRLSPALRSVLRQRRDLPGEAVRALGTFGRVDFTLPMPEQEALELRPDMIAAPAALPAEPTFTPPADASVGESPFVSLGDVARGLPVVAEALSRAEPPLAVSSDGFAISDLVARIEAFRRRKDEPVEDTPPAATEPVPEGFRFEADASGTIIGVQGVKRAPIIGLSIAHAGVQGAAELEAIASGGFRRRSRFEGARLELASDSSAGGSWRLTGVPVFDHATGRFTGFRGAARRPRADETAGPARRGADPSADSIRQLVHELRTPTNAISGFAELIESELLGPVPQVYRSRASVIRARAADLLDAIEDLDTASRIEMSALELRPGLVTLQPLVSRVIADLTSLAKLRGVRVLVDAEEEAQVIADDRAVERLIGRLLTTLVSAGGADETIRVSVYASASGVEIAADRPRAFAGLSVEALLALDGTEEPAEGAPLLGTGFSLRVARNLAAELGGMLEFGPRRLTLRLPAAVGRPVEQATPF